jgi:hypothetical protein
MKAVGLLLAAAVAIVVAGLLTYVFFLNQGRLETVNFLWVDHHPASDLPYVHVEGTVFNFGSSGARNVQLVTRIYDSQVALLKTEVADLGIIPQVPTRRSVLIYSTRERLLNVKFHWHGSPSGAEARADKRVESASRR